MAEFITEQVREWSMDVEQEEIKWQPDMQKFIVRGKREHPFMPYPEDSTFTYLQDRFLDDVAPAVRGLNPYEREQRMSLTRAKRKNSHMARLELKRAELAAHLEGKGQWQFTSPAEAKATIAGSYARVGL